MPNSSKLHLPRRRVSLSLLDWICVEELIARLAGTGLETGEYTTFTGSLETSHLVSQIESLRDTIRYLRSQNAFLRSHDLLKDLSSLPTYETAISPSSTSENARIIKEESNALFRQVAGMTSRAKVVDLSLGNSEGEGKGWTAVRRQPKGQLAAKRAQLEMLKKKIDRLAERKSEMQSTTVANITS